LVNWGYRLGQLGLPAWSTGVTGLFDWGNRLGQQG
jgi:hypothetical protein